VLGGRLYGTGRVIASQQDAFWLPRTMTRRYVIAAMHGAAKTASSGLDPVQFPGWHEMCRQLSDAGAVVVQADWDFDPWGNDSFLADVDAFRASLATTLDNLRVAGASVLDNSKLVLLAGSMGGDDAYRYAQRYPTRVKAMAGISATSDLIGPYTGTWRFGASDLGTTLQGEIGTAWGVTYPTALPDPADPYNNAALMAGCPTWLGYSDGDTTVPPAWVTAMATAIGPSATATKVSTTAAHGDPSFVAALGFGVVDWLLAQAS
jgi:pimeloyl-ACP methyl ester carboxylesterase